MALETMWPGVPVKHVLGRPENPSDNTDKPAVRAAKRITENPRPRVGSGEDFQDAVSDQLVGKEPVAEEPATRELAAPEPPKDSTEG